MTIRDTVLRKRTRSIVEEAGRGVKDSTVRTWLLHDEHGTWEQKAAAATLDLTSARAEELGLSVLEINSQCAIYLRSMALDAWLNFSMKG